MVRLADGVWDYWKTNGPDRQFGGFHGTLDRRGHPVEPTDKGVIQQSRHLWASSTWYEMREAGPEVKAISDSLYHFLIVHFREPTTSEFVFTVTREGRLKDPTRVIYANAFAIYALVQYARVYQVHEASQYALACFRSIDQSAHDTRNGGYLRANDPPWLTKGAVKETNTHLHLLEAFTTLYQYTRDPVVGARVEELLGVFLDSIYQTEGYASPDLTEDFKPFGEKRINYGHDLESSWLLYQAAEALGRTTDPRVLSVVTALGHNASVWGFDREKGGYFDYGVPGGGATGRDKVWWIQAEAIPALVRLYQLTKKTEYLDRLEHVLGWIVTTPPTGS